MEIAKHMIDMGDASAEQVCLSGYAAIIEEAITRAQTGDMFAPFHPQVLEALAGEYRKGAATWFAVSQRFKQANNRVPLGDLDRAMRATVAAEEGDEPFYNYSVVMGAALAAAKAGQDSAPFGHLVLDAFVGLWIRDESDPRDVGRAFERANNNIKWSDLEAAIQSRVFMMLGTPRAADIVSLADYSWDRPAEDSVELSVYRQPVDALNQLSA